MSAPLPEPPRGCVLCPRLTEFRQANASVEPDWFNAPVPSFGEADDTKLLVVGLAPGLKGANRTGRPFTGDYAGDLLYATLIARGFARGSYASHADDGLELVGAMITNAVRCVPPQNKPTTAEINTCRPFLVARMATLPKLKAILALGRIAHDQTLAALALRKSLFPFAHGASHELPTCPGMPPGVALFDSYHCSRYNTNTGRLTTEMFETVFDQIRRFIDQGH